MRLIEERFVGLEPKRAANASERQGATPTVRQRRVVASIKLLEMKKPRHLIVSGSFFNLGVAQRVELFARGVTLAVGHASP